MMQCLFPDKRPVYQDDNDPIHTVVIIRYWYNEHKDEVQHLVGTPHLIIIEHLWRILKTKLCSGFLPPTTLSEYFSRRMYPCDYYA